MTFPFQRLILCLLPSALAGCAIEPVALPLVATASGPLPPEIRIEDRRASIWKTTHLLPNLRGAIQQFGDDAVIGGLPNYVVSRISRELIAAGASSVTIKTIDVHVSIPDLRIPVVGKYTTNADQANYQLTATAGTGVAICITVDGNDYLGNDAVLGRYNLQKNVIESIERAIRVLASGIANHTPTDSPACQSGWEGGQP